MHPTSSTRTTTGLASFASPSYRGLKSTSVTRPAAEPSPKACDVHGLPTKMESSSRERVVSVTG